MTVSTPEGERTGSSIGTIKTSKGLGFPGPEAGGISTEIHGDAVDVDLGKRGHLFALLQKVDEPEYLARVSGSLVPDQKAVINNLAELKGRLQEIAESTAVITLKGSDLPTLVRFRDIADPRSIELVQPDGLADAFGPGVALESVKLKATQQTPSHSISKLFPWWDRYLKSNFDGSPSGFNDPRNYDPASHYSSRSLSE